LFDTGAVGDPSHQTHDWEPGIARSGLFWTIPISSSMVHVEADKGRARFTGQNVLVKDFHDFFSAIGLNHSAPKPVPSRVSFDVRWSGDGHRRKIHDKTFGFRGDYVTGHAKIQFTARDVGGKVVYKSVSAGQYHPTPKQGGAGSPAVGIERNGMFF
jgi:hypothetical protein